MRKPELFDSEALTDDDLGEIYALRRAVHVAAARDDCMPSVADMIAVARERPKTYEAFEWTAEGGYARLRRDPGQAACEVEIAVAEPARRRGAGTALAACAAQKARALGCTLMLAPFADETGRAFAARLGARTENSWRHCALLLPAVVDVRPVPGYSVRSWVGLPPEELLVSWAKALNAINDSPHADGVEPFRYTAEYALATAQKLLFRGAPQRVTVVVDEQSGEVVGSIDLNLGEQPGSIARTNDASVLAEHRRRGLMRWMKAESLTRLMAERPDVTMVRTSNGVTNVGMLSINHAVGFRPVATWTNAAVDL